MRVKVLISGLLFAVFCFYSLSYSDVPQMINYQGKITTPQGALIDTIVSMTFAIYTDSTGSDSLWSEVHSAVQVEKGIFSVLLGAVNPLSDTVFTGEVRYLGVKVGADPEMTPRKAIVSVAYALRAGTMEGTSGGTIHGDVALVDSLADTTFSIVDGNVHAKGDIKSGNSLTLNGAEHKLVSSIGEMYFGRENGSFGDIKIGIGTISPDEELHVVGNIKMVDGNQAAGKVLTSDANGLGTWQAAAGPGDNDWTFRITDTADTTLMTGGEWGIARSGNTLYGNVDSTHVNLGVECTTGASGQNYKYCTVGGGLFNTAMAPYATVAGGESNTAYDLHTTVGGGKDNTAVGWNATVGGGDSNTAYGNHATVGGGYRNTASSWAAAVAGGGDNAAGASYATIGGGHGNMASNVYATVGGGDNNAAIAGNATVGGGLGNTANQESATVGGGERNTASGWRANVGGGGYNMASGNHAAVGGGWHDTASGDAATVAGGYGNTASGTYASVGSGNDNTASGAYARIGGGYRNTASGPYSTIGGGDQNIASKFGATVPGGLGNTVAGAYSFAAGVQVNIDSTAECTFALGNYFGTSTAHAVIFYDAASEMKVGIQETSPTARLDVNSSTGYNQVRIRTSYTPTGTSDTNGNVGDIAWDDSYFYVKTTAGWKRAALSTW